MPSVNIKWPLDGNPRIPISTNRIVLAMGLADDSVIGIGATFWRTSLPNTLYNATTIALYRCPKTNKAKTCFKRWIVAMRLPDENDAEYEVMVTAVDPTGAVADDRKVFHVSFNHLVKINSVQSDEDITAQAADFMPYGYLSDAPLGPVTMTDASFNVTDPVYVFSDYLDLNFWCAQFPTLDTGVYTLFVADVLGGSSDSATNLNVD